MYSRLSALLIGLAMVLLTACSGTGQPAAEEASTHPDNDLLIAIEARWMCDLQRFAFPDLAAMDVELAERLEPNGLSREDYDSFKIRTDAQIGLRERVLAEYVAICGGD